MLALGPEQPYHKKHSPEKVGQQSFDPCLFANFSHNYAKIQNSFKENKFIVSKLLSFFEGVAELPFKCC